jgi:hypothetical protein
MRERETLERESDRLDSEGPFFDRDVSREFEGRSDATKGAADSLSVPLRWVCLIRLKGKYPDERGSTVKVEKIGTGILVGPRHVLTAAHTLDPFYKMAATQFGSIEVLPAHSFSTGLGSDASANAKSLRVSAAWRAGKKEAEDGNDGYDYGMIVLGSDQLTTSRHKALSNKPLGYWGHPTFGRCTVFASLDADFLENKVKTVYSAGYPPNEDRVWMGTGHLGSVFDKKGTPKRALPHYAMADLKEKSKGASGGPLWLQQGAVRFLLGVNTSVERRENKRIDSQRKTITEIVWMGRAARVTLEMFEEVIGWMHTDP